MRENRINGEVVDPKGQFTLQRGYRISFLEAGGGGFGAPSARAPALVLRDVRNGSVSVAGAKRDDGVEIDPAGLA